MDILEVLNTSYQPSLRWGERNKNSNDFGLFIRKIKNFLTRLSGYDLFSMFEDLIGEKDVKNFKTSKYVNALKGISLYAIKHQRNSDIT